MISHKWWINNYTPIDKTYNYILNDYTLYDLQRNSKKKTEFVFLGRVSGSEMLRRGQTVCGVTAKRAAYCSLIHHLPGEIDIDFLSFLSISQMWIIWKIISGSEGLLVMTETLLST